jgi:hypothetical protein
MKECPHCHEHSFGVRELFSLDYFSADECRACGKLVRNDGFRQFLTLPTILVALFLGTVIFSLIPSSLEPFGLLLIIVLAALPVVLLAKPVRVDEAESELTPFIPDLENDKVIMVSGWNEDELRKILDDFVEEEASAAHECRIDINTQSQNFHRLTFPADIHPSEFAGLVNYLNYPMNLGLAERSITVAGETTLNSDFHGIPTSLVGKKAILHVPENDQDYDVVYMQTETGATFAKSMSEGAWRPVNEPRLSGDVQTLIS